MVDIASVAIAAIAALALVWFRVNLTWLIAGGSLAGLLNARLQLW